MTERELLELAARAAGVELKWTESGKHYTEGEPFNPLTNDGDALRLAIACRLGISVAGGKYGVVECVSFKECHCFVSSREVAGDGDLEKATRRAIVRAAAEIGKGMA